MVTRKEVRGRAYSSVSQIGGIVVVSDGNSRGSFGHQCVTTLLQTTQPQKKIGKGVGEQEISNHW